MTRSAAQRRPLFEDRQQPGQTEAAGAEPTGSVTFYDDHPTVADLRDEALSGLARTPKKLPPKLFYDQRGSQLFDAITRLPEYYPTRTEIGLLMAHGSEMADRLGRGRVLIELGSGSSIKIQTLLSVLQPAVYVPVDISKEHLLGSAEALASRFPSLSIRAACADYSGPFNLPLDPSWTQLSAFFPGSSIGNFEPPQAQALLERVARVLGPGGKLLIGVDLRKDIEILEAAYNDAQGVTAAFNLNLLVRLNRELQADFAVDAFEHRALFNEAESRIEMHLVSREDQVVRIAGQSIEFARGETIHTESSYKYGIEDFQAMARRAGFEPEQVWTDARRLFSVHCLRVVE